MCQYGLLTFFLFIHNYFLNLKINKGWEQRKLGETLTGFEYGLNTPATDYDGINKYLRITDIDDVSHKFDTSHLTSPKLKDDNYLLAYGDILFARTGASVGKSYRYSNIDGKVYYAGFLIKAHIKDHFSTNFIFDTTLLPRYHYFVQVTSMRSGQPGINAKEYQKYIIYTPSENEQNKISDLVLTIQNLIDLQQRKLEQLKQLKIFTLQRMFIDKDCKQPILRFKNFKDNWLPHKFNDIANTFSGGTPAISNKDYYGGNIPFIRSAEINKNTTQLHLTPDGLKNSSAKFIKKGTLLYALYGATSGEVGIAQIDGAINQAVMAITLKKDNVYFIKTWLIKNKRKIISTYLQGGQGNLSAKIVKHLKLSLPKIEEEKLISITIMKIDSLIKLQQSKIDDLVNLKKYLLQKLFI